jgi:N-acetylglucosaminyl-diphospho-decaprenol L-rhamnosyltransferase
MNSITPAPGAHLSTNLLNKVTVVVVTHESAHCLQNLDPLLRQCSQVIVSDNGSLDGTPAQARERWPHAHVLEHGRNLGFGTANNRALARVQTPFAFLLNPDCVITAEALSQLIEAALAWPESALLAPELVSASGQPEVNYRWPQTLWRPQGPGAQGPTCVGFVCGAAMLLRLSAFSSLGWFDERFFLYYEDDDLCLRLFNARLPMVLVPAVTAVHHSRGSVRGGSPWKSEYVRGYHHAQSKMIFASKHQTPELAAQIRRKLLISTTLVLPFRLLAFSPRHFARMVGRWMGLLRWKPSPLSALPKV